MHTKLSNDTPEFTDYNSYQRFLRKWRAEYREISNAIRTLRVGIATTHANAVRADIAAKIKDQQAEMHALFLADKDVREIRTGLRYLRSKLRNTVDTRGAQSYVDRMSNTAAKLMERRASAKLTGMLQRDRMRQLREETLVVSLRRATVNG